MVSKGNDEKANLPEGKFRYLTGLGRIALFYFIGMSLFFIAGFTIISVRVSSSEKIRVPNVIGHLYLDEHNRLLENGFKVEIENKDFIEYPYGYILEQSLRPGKLVRSGARLILTVNKSKAVIKTPALIGNKKDLAVKIMGEIPIGGRIFSLETGVVTAIPSDKPRGEVLAQSPVEGTPVIPGAKIDLLISAGKARNKKRFFSKGWLRNNPMNVELFKQMAYLRKTPVVLRAKSVKSKAQDGKILSVEVQESGEAKAWIADVGTYRDKFSKPEGEDLPYSISWSKATAISLKPGDYTVFLTLPTEEGFKQEAQLPTEKEEKVISKYYVRLTESDASMPVFLVPSASLKFYEGYFDDSPKNVEEKKEEASILDDDKPAERVETPEIKPVATLSL